MFRAVGLQFIDCAFYPEVHRSQLEVDLRAMERREQELKAAKQNLEEQLDLVIRQSREALADTQVELNKYKLHSETLEKKHKVKCLWLCMLTQQLIAELLWIMLMTNLGPEDTAMGRIGFKVQPYTQSLFN